MNAEANRADFVVAPDGTNGNPGTLEQPFATPDEAQQAVREKIAAGLDADVTVLLRGGNYALGRPLVFGPEDGGTEDYSVTYAAYPGEQVLVHAGREITGWEPAGRRYLWQTTVPGVADGTWWFRQLIVDDLRPRRARWPEHNLLTVTALSDDLKEIEFDRELPDLSDAGDDVELVVRQNFSVSRCRVLAARGRTIKIATAPGWVPHGSTTVRVNCRAYLEHAPAFVNRPFEWHLDRRNGRLLCETSEDQDPNDRRFVAPYLEQLLRIEGRPEEPVRNLHFRGLDFAHTSWTVPQIGYSGIQACHYGNGYKTAPTYALPLAVQWTWAHGCSWRQCSLRHTGASGLGLGAGCRNNAIERCTFEDIGGNGVMVGWRPVQDQPPDRWMNADWSDPAEVPTGNSVSHCGLRDCGAVNTGGIGIWAAFCAETRIAHNLICDMPYSGISIGFRWDPTPTSQRACLVEYNHIHHIMQDQADGGGIYTLGLQPGTVLRGNLIHDVGRSDASVSRAPNNGIFCDEGSTGFLVEQNIIYDTPEGATRFNDSAADLHTWVDNSFGVRPGHPDFPTDRAAQAGPQPPPGP